MPNTRHVYVVVRQDLPLADQVVQACHAALEAGISFATDAQSQPEPANLVLLSVEHETSLQALSAKLARAGIGYELFFEPDDDMGHTAMATQPLQKQHRKHFRNLPLWTGGHSLYPAQP